MSEKMIEPLAKILIAEEDPSIQPDRPGKAKFLPPTARTRWCTECVKKGYPVKAMDGSALCQDHARHFYESVKRARAQEDEDVTTSAPRRPR